MPRCEPMVASPSPNADLPDRSGASNRSGSYGQHRPPSFVDRFGVRLSSFAVLRHADFDGVRFGDFGCGYEARFARTQLDRARSAVLVDLAVADDLKRHDKVTVVEGALPDTLPQVPSASLDVTLCLSVLEHLWHPQDAIRELRRVTAPGGVVLINVPSWLGKRFLELSAFRL